MTRTEILNLLATSPDLTIDEWNDHEGTLRINVTVEDFEGFDDSWSEILRDYDVELVDNIYETLKREADSVDEDYYVSFYFDGFYVKWGYASFDI